MARRDEDIVALPDPLFGGTSQMRPGPWGHGYASPVAQVAFGLATWGKPGLKQKGLLRLIYEEGSGARMASRRVEAERPVILLIENEEADIFLFRRALSHSNFKGTLRVVGSVSEARQYLLGSGQFRDPDYYPCPDLIVSDMSLPGATGNSFLEWLRQDSKCADIPFVFLSGSFQPTDKLRADELGANSFFAKTGDMNVMRERVEQMLKYLPPDRNRPEDHPASD